MTAGDSVPRNFPGPSWCWMNPSQSATTPRLSRAGISPASSDPVQFHRRPRMLRVRVLGTRVRRAVILRHYPTLAHWSGEPEGSRVPRTTPAREVICFPQPARFLNDRTGTQGCPRLPNKRLLQTAGFPVAAGGVTPDDPGTRREFESRISNPEVRMNIASGRRLPTGGGDAGRQVPILEKHQGILDDYQGMISDPSHHSPAVPAMVLLPGRDGKRPSLGVRQHKVRMIPTEGTESRLSMRSKNPGWKTGTRANPTHRSDLGATGSGPIPTFSRGPRFGPQSVKFESGPGTGCPRRLGLETGPSAYRLLEVQRGPSNHEGGGSPTANPAWTLQAHSF